MDYLKTVTFELTCFNTGVFVNTYICMNDIDTDYKGKAVFYDKKKAIESGKRYCKKWEKMGLRIIPYTETNV